MLPGYISKTVLPSQIQSTPFDSAGFSSWELVPKVTLTFLWLPMRMFILRQICQRKGEQGMTFLIYGARFVEGSLLKTVNLVLEI